MLLLFYLTVDKVIQWTFQGQFRSAPCVVGEKLATAFVVCNFGERCGRVGKNMPSCKTPRKANLIFIVPSISCALRVSRYLQSNSVQILRTGFWDNSTHPMRSARRHLPSWFIFMVIACFFLKLQGMKFSKSHTNLLLQPSRHSIHQQQDFIVGQQ